MLKVQNIFLIIIASFVIMTIFGEAMEQSFISKNAEDAAEYVAIAADCALANVIMTDEFFTSGVSSDNTYLSALRTLNGVDRKSASVATGMAIDKNGTGTFTPTNVFMYTYGITPTASAVSTIDKVYRTVYGTDTFKAWFDNVWEVQKDNPARSVYWTDTLMLKAKDARPEDTASPVVFVGEVKVPKLLTMGAELLVDVLNLTDYPSLYADIGSSEHGKIFDDYKKQIKEKNYKFPAGYKLYGNSPSANDSLSDEEKLRAVLEQQDYFDCQKTTSILAGEHTWHNLSAGSWRYYYTTPTSLGLTYIDPYVLDVLFRSNMDLLMRSNYLTTDVTTGVMTTSDMYNSWIEGTTYSVDKNTALSSSSDWDKAVINNGSMYYLRGIPTLTANGMTYTYEGTVLPQPEVEYIYYNFTAEDLKQWTPTAQTAYKETDVAKVLDEAVAEQNDVYNKNQEATGGNLTPEERTALNNILAQAINPGTTIERLMNRYTGSEEYNLIIAKVTFYADFAMPYTMSTMRGNAIHFGENTGSTTAVATEASMAALQVNEAMTEQDGVFTFSAPVEESCLVDGNYMYKYTTYFAVAT